MGLLKSFQKMGVMILAFLLAMMGGMAGKGWTAETKYPTRPIQIIVGFAPGSTDMAVRPFTEKLPDYLGQPTSFVYKPGAAGVLAASYVAKGKPDGYTLFAASQGSLLIAPLIQETIDYTLDDFAPISRLVSSPIVFVVRSDSSMKNLKDVVEEAKKYPGKLNFSVSGAFSTPHLPVEVFCRLAGIKLTSVPCSSTSQAVTALLGGHVSLASSGMAPLSPHLKSKQLRGIAVFEKQRLKEFPDIPTFDELGYPVVQSVWFSIFAHKKTPEEVIKKLHAGFKRAIDENRKSIEDRVTSMSLVLDFAGPEEFGLDLKAENEATKKIVKELIAAEKK